VSGRRFIGPCGHLHEHIVSQFAVCTVKGCEGVPACPKCGSTNVEPFSAPPIVPEGSFHCRERGHVWHPGV
jgi:hypothetical protein